MIPAINALGLLAGLPYEKTNWANTPINSIVSILLPWHPQTLADAEKRKNALRCLKNDNPSVFWKVLVKLLPNQTRTTSGNSKPEYLLLEIPEKIEITNAEVYEQYDFNLELAVEVSENEIEKLAFLAKQIAYMKESTFIDMKEKGMSKGEFTSVAQANGGLENMINWDGKDQDILALIKYIADEDKLEKVLENSQVIKTPVVRNGKQSTLGYQPDVWKGWN